MSANAALAAAHADARQRLQPVHLAGVLLARRFPQRARRDAFAAADDLAVGNGVDEMRRKRVGLLERLPEAGLPRERAVEPRRLVRRAGPTDIFEQGQRRAPALQLRHVGTADARAVAGEINSYHRRAPLRRPLRQPLATDRI